MTAKNQTWTTNKQEAENLLVTSITGNTDCLYLIQIYYWYVLSLE